MYVYPSDSQDFCQITDSDNVGIWGHAQGVFLLDHLNSVAGATTPPPTTTTPPPPDTTQPPPEIVPPPVIPPPGTPPPVTTPPPGGYITPTTPIPVNWPTSGQVVLHVNIAANQTLTYRLMWKSAMDPNKFGRISVVEQPGSAVMQHRLKLNNNGVQKFDSGWGQHRARMQLM